MRKRNLFTYGALLIDLENLIYCNVDQTGGMLLIYKGFNNTISLDFPGGKEEALEVCELIKRKVRW